MEELLKNQLFATHAVAAAGSVTLATTLTYPLDSLKVLVQVGSGSSKQLTTFQALQRVRSLSGYSGLYSGVGWLTSGRILGLGARFGIYEILTAFYKDGRERNFIYSAEAFMAGVAAGAMESLVSSPLELLKLRAQVTSASRCPSSTSITENRVIESTIGKLLHGYTPDKKALNHSVSLLSTLATKHPNLASALQEYPWMMTGSGKPPSVWDVRELSSIISLEGLGALWRGLRSGVARDSIFGGIFFCAWDFLHLAMLASKVTRDPSVSDIVMPTPPVQHTEESVRVYEESLRLYREERRSRVISSFEESGPLSPLAVSLTAGFSGSLAAAVSHCFDTAKVRSQCTVLPKYVSMERRLLKWRRPGNRFERVTGIHPADRDLLFRGIWLRMARSGLASFMIVGGYYLAVDYLLPG